MSDWAERLDAVARARGLPPPAGRRLRELVQIVAADSTAPTALEDPGAVADQHVLDSLSAIDLEGFDQAGEVVDIGSGAGFPGLALATAMPRSRFDLVESSSRRAAFVERAARAAGLDNVRVVCRRAEQWAGGEGAEAYDAATAKAVGRLATLVEYAAPLLRVGGTLVAWKGRRDRDEEAEADRAGAALGMALRELAPSKPFAGSGDRHLHVYEKVAPTPAGYPRRPGMAQKRPLGRK